MKRRDLVASAVAGAAGVLLVANASHREAHATPPGSAPRTPGDYIETKDGVRLFVRDWVARGAAASEGTIVFLHGWALRSEFWQYCMLPLSQHGYRCVAYDRRGHGRSADPGRGYDLDTVSNDLEAVLGALDLRDVTLVGHSFGGAEIVRYLSRRGAARVRGVALVSATLPYLLKSSDNPTGIDRVRFDAWRLALSRDFPKWLADNEGPFWTPSSPEMQALGPLYWANVSPDTIRWGRDLTLSCSLQAVVDCTYDLTEADHRKDLARIMVPTLIVHGREDRSVPVWFARQASQLVPGCIYEEYPNATHGLPVTHAETLTQDLLRFMK